MSDRDDFESWLQTGVDRGWCSQVCCHTHQRMQPVQAEIGLYETTGQIGCVPVVRVFGIEQVTG